ncbi:hypothetical protein LXL04_016194 [Taraxacum kok-saghyz]
MDKDGLRGIRKGLNPSNLSSQIGGMRREMITQSNLIHPNFVEQQASTEWEEVIWMQQQLENKEFRKCGPCDIIRITKKINKITRLTISSKRNYCSLGFPKRNHSPNKTVAGASRGYPTSLVTFVGFSGRKPGPEQTRSGRVLMPHSIRVLTEVEERRAEDTTMTLS